MLKCCTTQRALQWSLLRSLGLHGCIVLAVFWGINHAGCSAPCGAQSLAHCRCLPICHRLCIVQKRMFHGPGVGMIGWQLWHCSVVVVCGSNCSLARLDESCGRYCMVWGIDNAILSLLISRPQPSENLVGAGCCTARRAVQWVTDGLHAFLVKVIQLIRAECRVCSEDYKTPRPLSMSQWRQML